MNGNDSVNREGLADYLAREFAGEDRHQSPVDANAFDENDVASYARGTLLPGRRAAFEEAILNDPDLKAAVEYERSVLGLHEEPAIVGATGHRRRWVGWAAAAAAVLVALATLPFLAGDGDSLTEARRLLAAGDPDAAVRLLEQSHANEPTEESGQLLALARFADDDMNPGRGLDLGPDGDWAPLNAGELRRPAQVRGDSTPAIGIRGFVSARRPTLVCRRGTQPLWLILYEADGERRELLRHRVHGGGAGDVFQLQLPDSVADLTAGDRYGLELREGDRLLANADFKVAPTRESASCERLASIVTAALQDETQRRHALGNLYVRRGFYQEAVMVWQAIPVSLRSAAVSEALSVAEALLWNE